MADTGSPLPSPLRTRIESLSGMDMSAVRVHYNSPRPAQLGAQAHAQGTDIHLAPGQGQQGHQGGADHGAAEQSGHRGGPRKAGSSGVRPSIRARSSRLISRSA